MLDGTDRLFRQSVMIAICCTQPNNFSPTQIANAIVLIVAYSLVCRTRSLFVPYSGAAELARAINTYAPYSARVQNGRSLEGGRESNLLMSLSPYLSLSLDQRTNPPETYNIFMANEWPKR